MTVIVLSVALVLMTLLAVLVIFVAVQLHKAATLLALVLDALVRPRATTREGAA